MGQKWTTVTTQNTEEEDGPTKQVITKAKSKGFHEDATYTGLHEQR